MEYRLDVGMWNQVFAVPCALVDQHLKLAGKEQLQVILWLLRYPGQGWYLSLPHRESPGQKSEA